MDVTFMISENYKIKMRITGLIFFSVFFIILSGCRPKQLSDYETQKFAYKEREAILVSPKKAATGNPWIWRSAFFGAFPSVDLALLEKGFHVVYYDLTHLYGSPESVELGTDFYKHVVEHYNLSPKVTLEGFSRGGLFVFNWAAKNPERVACIYVDAPVCNIFSWPGREDKEGWNNFLREWNLTDTEAENFNGNPIDNLEPIARVHIPIIAVCGDRDDIVPYKENMGIVKTRYEALGGEVEVILKKGVGHHPHSLDNPQQIVDFILKNQ